MKSRLFHRILALAGTLLLLPPLSFSGLAAEDGTPLGAGPRSVEERRLVAAIEEQRNRLREQEENLTRRELELKTLEREVDKKLDELARAREEAMSLLARKDEAESKRLRDLSAMYEKMEPEKAAALLASMEDRLAVDILAGMKSKSAGRILSRMERGRAALLSQEYSKM